MSEQMNIYQKLQKCRVELQKSELRKSGKNTYSHYDYFELGDFLPRTNELFLENKLIGIVSFGEEEAFLTVRDTDAPDMVIQFACPNATINLTGAHAIQNIGALQTYQRRYLWIAAMELSENDAVDRSEKVDNPISEPKELLLVDCETMVLKGKKYNGMTLKEVYDSHFDYVEWYWREGPNQKIKDAFTTMHKAYQEAIDDVSKNLINEVKQNTIKTMIQETETNEKKFLDFFHVDSIAEFTNADFVKAMQMLTEKKAKMPPKELDLLI